MNKKTEIKYFHSILKENYKKQIKEDLKTYKDQNDFVRIDPRFLTNI